MDSIKNIIKESARGSNTPFFTPLPLLPKAPQSLQRGSGVATPLERSVSVLSPVEEAQ